MKPARRATKVIYGVIGSVLLILAAELIGQFQLAGRAWPPLTDVVVYVSTPAGASPPSKRSSATRRASSRRW